MRRADRLFQIVQLLRARRLATAADLANELEVSTRTVYRDVQDLIDGGVPIDGEAGVGYRLRKGFELKPMTFTVEEIEALVLGARLVQAWADPDLGMAVRSAMTKIETVLPEPLQASMLKTALFGPPHRTREPQTDSLRQLRRAIGDESWAWLHYVDGEGTETERTIVPLGLYFWGKQWLLASYCWLRNDYRSFRVDRVRDLRVIPAEASRLTSLEVAISLDAYVKAMEEREAANRAACGASSSRSEE
jgi:predicted DNA-binding transcriptional regulator YafY